MIVRWLLIFALLLGVAAGVAWLADNPGHITAYWGGYRVDASLAVVAVAVALFAVICAAVYRLWGEVWSTPRRLRRAMRARRERHGHLALVRGMAAIAAGDLREAQRQAGRADELLDHQPLARLVSAQAAQLAGDDAAARSHYAELLEDRETELLGLRGLLAVAQAEGDDTAALSLAERAKSINSEAPWALAALLDLQVKAGRWRDAIDTVRAAGKAKVMSEAEAEHKRAALLVALSEAAERRGDQDEAVKLARKARGLRRDFLPATLRLATALADGDKPQRARKVIEDAWPETPHPALARLYRMTGERDAIKQVQAMEKLHKLAPDSVESHLAVARAALDARLWGQARRNIEAASQDGANAEACRMMAELEDKENGDTTAAREWLERAGEAPPGPAWVCGACGAMAPAWTPACGNCGAFDRLVWRAPPRVQALPPGVPGAGTPVIDAGTAAE